MKAINDKLLKGSNLYNLVNNINNRFPKLKIMGSSEQETTTGKNLLNGVNPYKITGQFSKSIALEAGTYYIRCGAVTKGGTNNPFIVITGVGGIELAPNTNRSFTLPNAVTSVLFYSNGYDFNASQNITSYVEDIMISTTGGPYEPYTGGKIAPSPDFPMPIINKTIGNIELCEIDTYQDYIYGRPNNWYFYKNVRKLELAIADMNNDNRYPGWKGASLSKLFNDFPNKNVGLASLTSYMLNIKNGSSLGVGINTGGLNTSVLYLYTSVYNLTQEEWKEQYLNLIFILEYGLPETEISKITDKETIKLLNNMYLEKITEEQEDIIIN